MIQFTSSRQTSTVLAGTFSSVGLAYYLGSDYGAGWGYQGVALGVVLSKVLVAGGCLYFAKQYLEKLPLMELDNMIGMNKLDVMSRFVKK